MPNNSRHRRLVNAGFSSEGAEYLLSLVDSAVNKAITVANPAALTAPATIAATYTQAEVQALRDDIAALRNTVNTLITQLKA